MSRRSCAQARPSSCRSTSATGWSTTATRTPSSSSTSGPWRPSPTSATSTPSSGAVAHEGGRPSPGVGVVAPGGVDARRVLGDHHRRPHGDPADQLLRSRRLPIADRGGGRLRSRRGGAQRARAASDGPLHPVRGGSRPRGGRRRRAPARQEDRTASRIGTFDRGASMSIVLEDIDRDRMAVTLGSAVGGTMALEDGTSRSATAAASGSSTRYTRPPFLYEALVPSSLAAEVAPDGSAPTARRSVMSTGCTSGIDAIGYGHQLIQDGEADVVIAGGVGLADLADHGGVLRRRSGRPRAATTTRRGPRGRSTATGTASSWARAPRFSSWRSCEPRVRRGAHIYCEVAGFASRGNAFHMTGLRPDGAGDGRGDQGRDGARRGLDPADDRLHQRARLRHQAERPARDRRVQARLGEHAYKVADQLDQVDGRPLARRDRRDRDGRLRAGHRARRGPADRQLGDTATPSATSTTSPRTARERRVDVALSAGSGFGGFQSAMVLARPASMEVAVTRRP